MKKFIGLGAILLVCGSIAAVAYAQYFQPAQLPGVSATTSAKSAASDEPLAPIITAEELHTKIAAKETFILVDVRDAAAYNQEHVAGAINIPVKEIEANTSKLLPLDRSIVTMCAGDECKASTKAATKLLELGFTQVLNYDGGISGWKIHGYSVVSSPSSTH